MPPSPIQMLCLETHKKKFDMCFGVALLCCCQVTKMDAMPLRQCCTCNVSYCLCFCNSIILHYRQNERGANSRYTSRKACTLYNVHTFTHLRVQFIQTVHDCMWTNLFRIMQKQIWFVMEWGKCHASCVYFCLFVCTCLLCEASHNNTVEDTSRRACAILKGTVPRDGLGFCWHISGEI